MRSSAVQSVEVQLTFMGVLGNQRAERGGGEGVVEPQSDEANIEHPKT